MDFSWNYCRRQPILDEQSDGQSGNIGKTDEVGSTGKNFTSSSLTEETQKPGTSPTDTCVSVNPNASAPKASRTEVNTPCASTRPSLYSMQPPSSVPLPPHVDPDSTTTTQTNHSKSTDFLTKTETWNTGYREFPLNPDEAQLNEDQEFLVRVWTHAAAKREQIIKFEKEVNELEGDPEEYVKRTVQYLYKIGFRSLSSTVWTVYQNRSEHKQSMSEDEQLAYERTYLRCLLEDAF